MARIVRFHDHRFIGARDEMIAYDTDDDRQAAALEARLAGEDLLDRDLLQAFAPDEPTEVRNRGFRLAQ